MKKKRIIDYIAKTAIFSALSFILYLFPKFPLPFFPSFLDIQFSNLPALLGGFVLGPLGGCIIVIVRCLLKLILGMSSTAGAGEIADLLLGLAVVFTSSMIYKYNKNRKGGIVALIVAVVVWVVSSVFINCYINIPVYLELFFKGDIEGLVAMCKLVIKGINADNFMEYYIKYAVIPFNFILATLVSLITFFVYKRISLIFKKDFFAGKKTKVLVICDSFKGTLSSKEVGEIIVENINKDKYTAEYLPISDGGEGFLDTLIKWSKNLKEHEQMTCDAFRRVKSSRYLFDKNSKTLYFELAECVGIKDLSKEELNPYRASTYGLGIAIKNAIIKHKPLKVIVGIGGSASNDGGSGMLEAMGVMFVDKNGNVIHDMANDKLNDIYGVTTDSFNKFIKGIEFEVLTDVSNPLLGETGATYVFSPQKGANDTDLPILESNMAKFSEVCKKHFENDFAQVPGTGAAGGVGFAFVAFMNAKLSLGIDVLLSGYQFDKLVEKYDLVITGEGRLDEQSLNGKVISGIMNYHPKRLEFVVGQSKLDNIEYPVHAIVPEVATIDEALSNPKECLKRLIKKSF
ncbi:MAG: glycerate kinase [Bacilli bacterium]|nr:glycerate kinase [Bacilli bacterium]